MSTAIDYYFTSLSPYAYLGHNTFTSLANQHNIAINYKPIKLAKLFGVLGVLPVKQRPQARQDYRLIELGRWSKKRDLALNLHPAFFPADPSLADRCAIVLQQTEQDVGEFIGKVLAACWAQEQNIADTAVIQHILTSINVDADSVLQQALSTSIDVIYEANTVDAIEKGVLGVPTYIYQNEPFWGQDRVDLLNDKLSESLD
ncbi:2-hydroxychromene-2-carboxylate isomerase [Shewanella livingstonensis]|uniref:2-hydroxychromene-2-carboxylate isomerase n=1 Tax=Shewanella livingstonensis TaxID=150120 RepID=A0A3G8LZG6_9GAMM|nr:2-hydroxychromene-2-carboxylate isomerase [Shewanella livingstonensis]AZG74844.1 2-hydroxychromene-2-carboxylate isomerase [Shewanella livingstonensis]